MADLKKIGKYTQENWGAEQRNKYLAALDKKFHWLAENPQLGIKRDDVKEGYYCFPEGSHLVFYRINQLGIVVLGVSHQSIDVQRHFEKEQEQD